MRHLGSIVLAIVFAPLTYLLAGYGQERFVDGTAGATTHWNDLSIGIVAIVVAAALYSILVMARISPLGPFLAALAFIGIELWAVFDQASLVKLLGTSVLGVRGAQVAPLSGLALFMAIPLIITIVSPTRWRGQDKTVSVSDNGAAPTYGTPGSAAPAYAPLQTTPETAAEAEANKEKAEADAEMADAEETKAEAEADREEAKAEKE